MKPSQDLMTVRQAADFLGIAPPSLYEAIHAQRIPSVSVLGHYGLKRQDVEEYKQRVHEGRGQEQIRRGGRPRRKRNLPSDNCGTQHRETLNH